MSGFQQRKSRVARGLPRYSPAEAISRRAANILRVEERHRSNLLFVAEVKLERGCADCGYNTHSAALDFDHLPGTEKVDRIARLLGGSRSVLLAEMAKCEVVCANCHRVRTWQRLQDRAASGE